MTNIIKLSQISPFQKRIYEAVQAYPEVTVMDLVTLIDSTKTITKTGVYRLLALGYIIRVPKTRDDTNNRGRKTLFGHIANTEADAIKHQKQIGDVPKRDPRPSELARRMEIVKNAGTAPIKLELPPARTTPMLSQSELDELKALRRWKAFAIQLYPQLNQPDEIFEAREILMRQYPNDPKHREDIGSGKHDSGPAMLALIEVLQRGH